ncbi:hypothetical protein MIDIC_10005 [Alphaproteobacteria bacterium]
MRYDKEVNRELKAGDRVRYIGEREVKGRKLLLFEGEKEMRLIEKGEITRDFHDSIRQGDELHTGNPHDKAVGGIEGKMWEKVYQYSLDEINLKNNQVTKYLVTERGYSLNEITKMGAGYIPNKKKLANYLKIQGMLQEQIKEVNKALGVIGYTHKLVVPYRDEKGDIIGLAARNIRYNEGGNNKLGKVCIQGVSKEFYVVWCT